MTIAFCMCADLSVKLPGEDEGHWIEREPKRGSARPLPLTETVYRALVRHMALRNAEAATRKGWSGSGYVFVSVTGAPLHERNVSEAFHAICDSAKVPRLRFHDTRHTCGTLLHVGGADPFVIKEVLGHTQLSTTKRYTHVPIQATKAALDSMEALVKAAKMTSPESPVTVKTTVKSEGPLQ